MNSLAHLTAAGFVARFEPREKRETRCDDHSDYNKPRTVSHHEVNDGKQQKTGGDRAVPPDDPSRNSRPHNLRTVVSHGSLQSSAALATLALRTHHGTHRINDASAR